MGFIYFFQAPGEGDAVPVQSQLLRHDFGLRFYQDAGKLSEALKKTSATGVPTLVLLAGTLATSCKVAAAVRRADPAVTMVALLPEISQSALAQAMQSGMDVCWPRLSSPDLLVACISRLLGRAVGTSGLPRLPGHASGWKLVSKAWLVQTPQGVGVPLTTAERSVMMALCQAAGRPLSHAEILQSMHFAPHADARPSQAPARRLSVLISRLRRKFEAAGSDMPIRSVRGQGYELCAEFDTETTSP